MKKSSKSKSKKGVRPKGILKRTRKSFDVDTAKVVDLTKDNDDTSPPGRKRVSSSNVL